MKIRTWSIVILCVYCVLVVYATTSALLGIRYSPIFTPLVSLLAFSFALLHGFARLGWRKTLLQLALTFGVSLLFESVGVATGWVYGPYHYTDKLGPMFLGLVPYLIPVAWFMMTYPSFIIAHRLARTMKNILSEVKLGLIPAVISPHIIRAIGATAAKRLFLTGAKFGSAEAQRLGLLSEVVAADALDGAVDGLTKQLLENAPEAMAAAKELVQFVASKPLGREVIDGTAERIAKRRASAEGKEGLTAFLEKRTPAWRKE